MARKLVVATLFAVALAAILLAVTPQHPHGPLRPRIEVQPLPPLGKAPAAQVVPVERPAPDCATDDDDAAIRTLVAAVSSHPALVAWLASDDLLERFVAAVNAVAGGVSPREELAPLRPPGGFLVEEREGRRVISASSYRRYDLVAEVVASVDAEKAVVLYSRLRPQLEDVQRRVSWRPAPFDAVLERALDELLAVPIPDGDLEVRARTLTYAYADPGLEALSDAQRHLLRMGPRNARRVQDKLLDIRLALAATAPQAGRVAGGSGGEVTADR